MITKERLRDFLDEKKRDPEFLITSFAEECGISIRTFQRILKGDVDFYLYMKPIQDTANKHGYKKFEAIEMKRVTVCRDGGTALYLYKNKIYYMDFRIRTITEGEWYNGYPMRDNSNIITDKKLVQELNDELNKLLQYGKQ